MYVERKNGIYLHTHYARKFVGGAVIMTGDMKSTRTPNSSPTRFSSKPPRCKFNREGPLSFSLHYLNDYFLTSTRVCVDNSRPNSRLLSVSAAELFLYTLLLTRITYPHECPDEPASYKTFCF
jgi:hypothetical protein